MMLDNILYMMLGAFLIGAGFVISAVCDRIRGMRHAVTQRDREPRESKRTPAKGNGLFVTPVPAVPVMPINDATERMGADVALALVTSGFTKHEARAAVDACKMSERGTFESWARAALRRAGQAGQATP